jgi:hypothetical protein
VSPLGDRDFTVGSVIGYSRFGGSARSTNHLMQRLRSVWGSDLDP